MIQRWSKSAKWYQSYFLQMLFKSLLCKRTPQQKCIIRENFIWIYRVTFIWRNTPSGDCLSLLKHSIICKFKPYRRRPLNSSVWTLSLWTSAYQDRVDLPANARDNNSVDSRELLNATIVLGEGFNIDGSTFPVSYGIPYFSSPLSFSLLS